MRSLGGAGDGNDKCSSLKVAHERSGYPCPAGELLSRQRPSSSPGKKRKPTSKKRFFASRAEETTHKAEKQKYTYKRISSLYSFSSRF
jgi:hypothetical protein